MTEQPKITLLEPIDVEPWLQAALDGARWWRIVPKRRAPDVYFRRWDAREEAELALRDMRKRHTYKVAAFNRLGKSVDD